MLPELNLSVVQNEINAQSESSSEIGRTFLYDYESKEHKIIDGKLIEASVLEAVQQWIQLVLRTEKGKYKVYSSEFGLEVRKYKGTKGVPFSFVAFDIKRQIEEQLKKHKLISGIQNFEASKSGEWLNISFETILKDSTVLQSEVSI